jgi:replicative DNA helicase
MPDIALERGLPCNLDAERFVLGGVLLDDTRFPEIAAALTSEDFSVEKHRRIFARMCELYERSERIDRVTLANELRAHRQLESCDGVGYLVSLDEGLPELAKFDSYIRIVCEKARLRQFILVGQRLIDNALMDDGTPAHELASAASERLLQIGTSDKENRLASVNEIIHSHDGLSRFLDHTINQRIGVQTGFSLLDEMTGGLQRGDLVVIAGRPSMGKTAFALNLAVHAAVGLQRLSVAVFSLEMSRDSLLTRMLCSAAGVDATKQRSGHLNQEEKRRLTQTAEQLHGARLFIDDTSGITAMDISAKLRRLRADNGVDLCIIDYLGLIASHRKTENRVRELGEITRHLKLMVAKELHIPVVLLSQLSRAPETRSDHRPILSDLRESGDIEQDADVVALIYRGEIYHPSKRELSGLAELLIAKQRNGPTGRVDLVFRKEFTRFEEPITSAGQRE